MQKNYTVVSLLTEQVLWHFGGWENAVEDGEMTVERYNEMVEHFYCDVDNLASQLLDEAKTNGLSIPNSGIMVCSPSFIKKISLDDKQKIVERTQKACEKHVNYLK